MSNELKEALVEIDSEAETIASSIVNLKYELDKVRGYEDDLEELRNEVESLKDEVANLSDENAELEAQLEVLKKNLPEAERELTLWRLQRE